MQFVVQKCMLHMLYHNEIHYTVNMLTEWCNQNSFMYNKYSYWYMHHTMHATFPGLMYNHS